MHGSILNQKGPFHSITSRITLVLLLLFLCRCAQSNTIAEHPFIHGLDFKGFGQKGPLLIYNPKNIFEYMNGEAENYLPNGFILLYVGKFIVKGRDAEMLMEVYDMGSSKGVESLFRIYARPPGEALSGIGENAWKSKSRCVFHRGPYFIRITGNPAAGPDLRPSPDNIEALARDADRVLGK
ncbi:MAG: hypothetical protein GY797_14665 [Deltaproteobacteria bacterium]|nr:hypothetical protein [Deltaproteobacteria bacterium]